MKKRGISGSTLKIIAMIAMLIDHIGAVILEPLLYLDLDGETFDMIYQINQLFRFIGRIAFPIFLFLLVEGYLHTHNKKKYARNLFFFALLSEIPFDLAVEGKWFDFTYQNVMVTLLFAYFALWLFDTYKMSNPKYSFLGVFILAILAEVCKTDYGAFGVIAAVILYIVWISQSKEEFCFYGAVLFLWKKAAALAFIPIYFYNGKRGSSIKYIFYCFYPVHLLVLWAIRFLCFKC